MGELVISKKNEIIEKYFTITVSEEELAIIHMALIRGLNSSNAYFREGCERLLKKTLGEVL